MIYPDVTISESTNTVLIDFDQRTKGVALMENNVKITQVFANTTWNINHNLGKNGVIAQFFNTSGELIKPESYHLTSNNKCTATFYTATAGFVLLKFINSIYK